MKKLYSFLMMAVMAVVMSFTAKAASVTINVDDPNRVSVQLNYVEQTLVAGDNTFDLTVGNYTTIYINAKEGALLKSVVNAAGTTQSISYGMVSIYESPTEDSYSQKYIVTSVALAEARTATCKITVDNAANIGGLQMSSTNERVTLVDGENEVKFIPDMESPFNLSPNYESTFYKVTVDGTEVTEEYGSWYLYVKDGSVVDIKTEFPDEEVVVNVAFATEESKEALTGITVDGETVTPDADGNIKVKLGKTIKLLLDNVNYAIDSFTINGEVPSNWYNSSSEYEFIVKAASNIVIGAHKYSTFKVTISVEHPECVVVKDANSNVLNLVAGDNEIEVSENSASITVTKAAGCKITSVLVNGNEANSYGYDSSYGTTINIPSDGTTIVIVANEIVYDNNAIVYIDDECYSYSSMTNATTRDQVYLVKGENKIGFNNGEEAHRLYVMTKSYNAPAAIYCNGLYVTNLSNSDWTLANGDYIKVFINEKPEEYAVTFAMAEGLENSVVSVAVEGKDYADWANGLNVIADTKVNFTLAEGVNATVLVDNKEVKATEGVYTITVNGTTKVRIVALVTSVTPAEGTANPFAYALSSEVVEGKLNVNYSLNTEATSVAVKVVDATGTVVAKVAGETAKGAHTTEIALAELEVGSYTWEVEVAGTEKTAMEEFHKVQFYHPRGVDVDNNMESPAFGHVYVTEGMTTSNTKYYQAANGGVGLYIFTPAMESVVNEVTGKYAFMSDLTYTFISYGADLARVRVAEDGRIFVSRCNNAGDYILYAPSHDDLVKNNKFTSLLAGGELNADTYEYHTADGFLAAGNIGMDIKGAGEDLKLMTIAANKGVFGFNASGSRVDEYALGEADVLPTPTKIETLSGYTIAPQVTNVEYDNQGGVWYCQYRGTPSDTEPALIYVDANGEQRYFEGEGGIVRGGGGIRISPDGKQIAIATSKTTFSIYDLVYNEDGSVELTEKTKITHGIGTNCYDIAWDLAGNIYICGNSGEWMKGFALPRTEAFTTKAASKYAFDVTESSAIDAINADTNAPVEYYNLQGVKVTNPENGIFIKKQGGKTTKVVL